MDKKRSLMIMLPLIMTVCICLGLFLGIFISKDHGNTSGIRKLKEILSIIDEEYVDTVNIDDLIERAIPDIMAQLDPHSTYISKQDLQAVNEELEGSFSGVGVSFQISNDTVVVLEVITGGPAEKVGLRPGDRIIAADGFQLTGPQISSDDVFKHLRGDKGSKVSLKVKRPNSAATMNYDVVRGEIPDRSVTASYMANDKTGFIKITKFTRTTYDEFMNAMAKLSSQGAKQFVIDLRDNQGGYMEPAIFMANEFLDKGRKIVYTKGRSKENQTEAVADGNGAFRHVPISLLTNEYTASAAEIFAGAIQDNDRGVVVGRRTFGKGLVQSQIMLSDSSAIRLTVARYYTPSGRSIQKEYAKGKDGKYQMDIEQRYLHGEMYHQDSIKLDKSKVYRTVGGRTVYGGGGIMPDIFVPEDTTAITSYYINVSNDGLLQRFAFDVTEKYRPVLGNVKTAESLLQKLPREETLLNNFVQFGVDNGVPARWYYIRQSEDLLLHDIKSLIVRDVLGYNEFFRLYYQRDPAVKKAIEALDNNLMQQLLRNK